MKSKQEALELRLKINDIGLAIDRLKTWNTINGRKGNEEKYQLNKERIVLFEESKQLFLSTLKEMEKSEPQDTSEEKNVKDN